MANQKKAAAAADLVEMRFNGEPHHKLVVGDLEIVGGQTGRVDRETADTLLASDWANVSLADAPIWPYTEAEIDELAAKLGIDVQAPAAGGVPIPTLKDKIAALEAAGHTPESAAAAAAEADAGSTTSDDGSGGNDRKVSE